ncbi:MAG: NIL domain-containing protein [Candidatus Omnitrophica bacterium]|nr:NIL domain-containing protein [Candidatus Omnitrophota bacterium]MDD5512483.1 NIL domain-containing protein [Candidatus Omnitrophota bacterium]
MQISVGLAFPGELKDDSVICYICKNFDIQLNIIEASFSMSDGWAILQFEAEEPELKRTFAYLESKGIKIQKIQEEKS